MDDNFVEAVELAKIKNVRDMILSYIMYETAHVLNAIEKGAFKQVRKMIVDQAQTSKKRLNDFFALMYLMLDLPTDRMDAQFKSWLLNQDNAAGELSTESNEIAGALHALFDRYKNACRLAEEQTAHSSKGLFSAI